MAIASAPQAELSGWGRYPRSTAAVIRPERLGELKLVSGGVIARGLGRSYGDAAINDGRSVILTERLNRFLSFDAATGVLRAEAGVTMGDVLQTFVPKGWFLPVTPGTKFVTLGGAAASDIHGKNHHRDGSFGRFVNELRMLLADGSIVNCSPTKMPELFWATVGGMGLTGVILEVTFRLIPVQTAYIHARSYEVANLGEALKVLSDPAMDDNYSVCWLDTTRTGASLGKGIVFTGHHASRNELPSTIHDVLAPHRIRPGKKVPVSLPLLSGPAVKLFNRWYAWQNNKKDAYVSHYDQFFYPLDAIANWNLLYGSRGLLQYQVVVPAASAESALSDVLKRLQQEKLVSFLTVLKRMGPESGGYLSFPKEGFTLSLDIPVSGNPRLFTVLDEMDKKIVQSGGRVYLSKDGRMKPNAFRQMYPRLEDWQAVKLRVDPDNIFTSDLSRRLALT